MRTIIFSMCLLASAAYAADKPQTPTSNSSAAAHTPPPGLQGVNVPQLQEIKGVVSWETLAKVSATSSRNRIVPLFGKEVVALNDQEVKIQGFMMPLDPGQKQKHFILSVNSATCAFCMPAGPEGVVEVKSLAPIKYGFEPIIVSGKLSVMKDDPTGLYYRMTDAVQASK